MADNKKQRMAMVINAKKCFDCKACMIACKVKNKLPPGTWRNWVRNDGGESGLKSQFQPGQCMQCEKPSCVAACPVGATYALANGIVVVDAGKCIGCGNCVTACPYGARFRNPVTQQADKCDFCLDRLEAGQIPACVETCPTKARVVGDLNDPRSEVSLLMKEQKLVHVGSPQVDTKPQIFYFAGTHILDWAVAPTLPGNVHMPAEFWQTYEKG